MLTLLLLACSTVYSANPLAERYTVFPELLGDWKPGPDQKVAPEDADKYFRILKNGRYMDLYKSDDFQHPAARFGGVKLGGQRYLDIQTLDQSSDSMYFMIARLELEDNQAAVSLMDTDWFKKQAEAGADLKIPFRAIEGDILLMAPTRELRRWVKAHAKDSGLFVETNTYVRYTPGS